MPKRVAAATLSPADDTPTAILPSCLRSVDATDLLELVQGLSNDDILDRCKHGRRQRSRCKECGGAGICKHGRQRPQCKECGSGSIFCQHGRRFKDRCKECARDGTSTCKHGRYRYLCKDCGGAGICQHERQRAQCKECGGGRRTAEVVRSAKAKPAVEAKAAVVGGEGSLCSGGGGDVVR
jgi:hypothetical protein